MLLCVQSSYATEALVRGASAQLARLARALEAGEPAPTDLFATDARVTLLWPSYGDALTRGDLTIRLVPESDQSPDFIDPASALAALTMPSAVTFKTIGITELSNGRFETVTMYDSIIRHDDQLVQQNATWQIVWRPGAIENQPKIESIRLVRFEEVASRRSLFVDATQAVIGATSVYREQLRYGANHWTERIDAVGESNFFGHQGLAVGDVNGDGLEDLYVAMGTGLPNKLFIQQPDGSARDMAADAGVAWLDDTKGVLLVDLDNDGDQDLLCAMGPAIVYCRNDGAGRFTPYRSMRASTDAAFYSLAAADYDLDGDLDIYGCRYVKIRYGLSVPLPFHDAENGPPNHLLRNDGPAGFTDVTAEVGLSQHNTRFSLSATWIDYDNDGDPDLYVANDFGRNNLYRNEGGKFMDVAAVSGTQDQAAGMGVSWSDVDNDGDFDLYVSNMFSAAGQRIAYQPKFQPNAAATVRTEMQRYALGNSLFANRGDGTFEDISVSAGVRMGRWSWGAKFVDLDNDGFDDLVVPNGFVTNTQADDL